VYARHPGHKPARWLNVHGLGPLGLGLGAWAILGMRRLIDVTGVSARRLALVPNVTVLALPASSDGGCAGGGRDGLGRERRAVITDKGYVLGFFSSIPSPSSAQCFKRKFLVCHEKL
jgi:hypothetical protein